MMLPDAVAVVDGALADFTAGQRAFKTLLGTVYFPVRLNETAINFFSAF
jgi:hypothetical protein